MRAAPAARSQCDLRTPAVIPLRAGVEPRPYRGLAEHGRVGGDRDGGTSRTPSPTGFGKAGPRAAEFTGYRTRRGGNSENVAGGGVLISFAVVEDAVPCWALPVSRLYERKMPPEGGIFLFAFWFT